MKAAKAARPRALEHFDLPVMRSQYESPPGLTTVMLRAPGLRASLGRPVGERRGFRFRFQHIRLLNYLNYGFFGFGSFQIEEFGFDGSEGGPIHLFSYLLPGLQRSTLQAFALLAKQ